jgi:hypothetical protein
MEIPRGRGTGSPVSLDPRPAPRTAARKSMRPPQVNPTAVTKSVRSVAIICPFVTRTNVIQQMDDIRPRHWCVDYIVTGKGLVVELPAVLVALRGQELDRAQPAQGPRGADRDVGSASVHRDLLKPEEKMMAQTDDLPRPRLSWRSGDQRIDTPLHLPLIP